MPYLKEEDLTHLYKEIDKANADIDALTLALDEEKAQIEVLKKHRLILGVFALIFLLLMIWSFIPKPEKIPKEYLIKKNLSLINTDSLHQMQLVIEKTRSEENQRLSVKDLPIVYSVQIGAYTNFKSSLLSQDLTHLTEYSEDGMNKYALGNFSTYKEAVQLRNDLKRLGFEDCFIVARSYGEPVNITEALQLSGEKWIRGE